MEVRGEALGVRLVRSRVRGEKSDDLNKRSGVRSWESEFRGYEQRASDQRMGGQGTICLMPSPLRMHRDHQNGGRVFQPAICLMSKVFQLMQPEPMVSHGVARK